MSDLQHGAAGRSRPSSAPVVFEVRALVVHAAQRVIVRVAELTVPAGEAVAIVGPSGVGKSTLLRCLNRMVDLTPALRVEGDVLFQGQSVWAREVDPDALRARMGFLFQQPVVFPRSIVENVLFGVRHQRRLLPSEASALTERVLREAALWEEVRDRLREPARRLSVGQQQRLCLARALALEPEVLLLDEPTSSLDQKSRELVETSLQNLRGRCAMVLVTHDLGQAGRLADWIATFERRDEAGELIRVSRCSPGRNPNVTC